MKNVFLSSVLCVLILPSFSQNQDTTVLKGESTFFISTDSVTGQQTLVASPKPGRPQPVIRVRGNLSLAVDHPLSFVEELIINLESDECEALRKRDQLALRRLWAKDFTIQQKQNKLVTNDNPLPSYLSFGRMIEKITVVDSATALVSGYEMYQEFTTGVNTSPRTIQKFFHAWTKQNGFWKLSTKTHE